MEAKVDIRKLQFLNDRIAQVTDALNQVRFSVHGLQQQQLGLQQPQFGYQQFGFQQHPYGPQQAQLGFQQPQFGIPPQLAYGAGIGFQHTPFQSGISAGVLPFGQLGWQPGLPSSMTGGLGLQHAAYGGYGPYLPQGIQGMGQAGWGGFPTWPGSFGGGLYHSPIEQMEQRLGEQRANDPHRILQTFPLCLIPASSVPTW